MAKLLSREEFITKCTSTHGDKYDYSKLIYINSRTKVEIICKIHGSKWVSPDHHSSGKGCLDCGNNSAKAKTTYTNEKFIIQAKEVHGDRYDYSKVEYVNSQNKVIIICTRHGEFLIKPNKHIHSKRGCEKCGYEKSFEISKSRRTSDSNFILKCIAVHGDKYDYTNTVYSDMTSNKISIICPKHGEFLQIAYDHLDGHGCNKCPKNTNTSAGHKEILEFLDSLKINYKSNDRTVLFPQELDVYVEELKLAIEFNGVYWHSKYPINYHYNKYKSCKDKSIFLYQFWDLDWKHKKELIKSMIASRCKSISTKLDARKCSIIKLDTKDYKSFLESNHIQGYCYSTSKIGLCYNSELVAVIGFNKNILNRYCQKINASVRGGMGKLLKHYILDNKFGEIYTFSDNMYSDGNVYKKLGFTELKVLRPDYKYFDGKKMKITRKEHFRRKRLLKYSWYDPLLSESQNMLKAGYRKIYDAGKIKWILKL